MTRAELVLLFLGLFLLTLAAMWWGWQNRAKRQAGLPELPAVPNELGVDLAPQLTGLYVGTTVATEWQNRADSSTISTSWDRRCRRRAMRAASRRGRPAWSQPATSPRRPAK